MGFHFLEEGFDRTIEGRIMTGGLAPGSSRRGIVLPSIILPLVLLALKRVFRGCNRPHQGDTSVRSCRRSMSPAFRSLTYHWRMAANFSSASLRSRICAAGPGCPAVPQRTDLKWILIRQNSSCCSCPSGRAECLLSISSPGEIFHRCHAGVPGLLAGCERRAGAEKPSTRPGGRFCPFC